MKSVLFFAGLVAFTFVGCANPTPTCAPKDTSWTFCSEEDNALFTCPAGTPEQVANNAALNQTCFDLPDDQQFDCLFALELEMVDAVLAADCAAAGQICVLDPFTPEASGCEDPQ